MNFELTTHKEASNQKLNFQPFENFPSQALQVKDLKVHPAANLKFLSNEELNSQLQSLVRQEREVLSEILHHIAEVDRRRLYLDMAYPNLFIYLTQHLGYSSGSAQRRIDAARLLKDVPTLTDKLESGNINLMQVSVVQKAIRQKKKESKASHRQNKDDTRTTLGKHDLAKPSGLLSAQDKQDLLEQLSGQSFEATQKIVAQTLDLKIQQAPQVRHQKDNSVRFEVTFSEEQWQKLQRMRELLSNSLPTGSWDQVLEYVADKVITQKTKPAKTRNNPNAKSQGMPQPNAPQKGSLSKHQPDKNTSKQSSRDKSPTSTSKQSSRDKSPTDTPNQNPQSQPSPQPNNRPIPAAIKRQVLQKDLCCQYVDPKTKRQCAAKWNLHIDHIQPRWAGGSNDPQNLRVLCQQHNLHIYQQQARLREKS